MKSRIETLNELRSMIEGLMSELEVERGDLEDKIGMIRRVEGDDSPALPGHLQRLTEINTCFVEYEQIIGKLSRGGCGGDSDFGPRTSSELFDLLNTAEHRLRDSISMERMRIASERVKEQWSRTYRFDDADYDPIFLVGGNEKDD